jgi:hypothetical protein
MYLKNPGLWEDPTNTEEPDDGEEVCVDQISVIKIVTLRAALE